VNVIERDDIYIFVSSSLSVGEQIMAISAHLNF
jgi:hypothetical protein